MHSQEGGRVIAWSPKRYGDTCTYARKGFQCTIVLLDTADLVSNIIPAMSADHEQTKQGIALGTSEWTPDNEGLLECL